jgi:hypothetical protein
MYLLVLEVDEWRLIIYSWQLLTSVVERCEAHGLSFEEEEEEEEEEGKSTICDATIHCLGQKQRPLFGAR